MLNLVVIVVLVLFDGGGFVSSLVEIFLFEKLLIGVGLVFGGDCVVEEMVG